MAGQAWQRSTPRKDRSSWQWQQARARALARDGYQCRAIVHDTHQRCTIRATEVDHIDQTNNHELSNLISLCVDHHRIKTQREATAARWKYREKRTPEKHPGLTNR